MRPVLHDAHVLLREDILMDLDAAELEAALDAWLDATSEDWEDFHL